MEKFIKLALINYKLFYLTINNILFYLIYNLYIDKL